MLTNQSPWPDSGQILHHQYGISVAEAQTPLLVKMFQVARSEEKQLFSQAIQIHTICTFILDFKIDLQIQTLILIVYSSPTTVRHFPLKICGLEFHSFVQTAQEITCNLQNQREVIFDLPHPCTPGTGLFRTIFPTPGPKGLDLSWGLPGVGDGNRLNWTMHKPSIWNKTFNKCRTGVSAVALI